jgi:hypothetical protein
VKILGKILGKIAVLAALACVSCSTADDQGPVFANEGAKPIACMQHQPAGPGRRYTDPAQRRTDETLPLLRYYTENGRKPYCDKASASDTDRAWAQLYVDLGADSANVAAILH